MNLLKTLKTQKGFSLVELMVVVAIIGILATMAVPQINKFMAKARQAEAKTSLSSIYTANKAFFAEYQGFTSSLRAMGYQPEGELRYNAGWTDGGGVCPTNFTSTCNTQSSFRDVCGTVVARGTAPCWLMYGTNNQAPAAVTAAVTPNGTFQNFTAAANAFVRGSTTEDQWTVNESKDVRNTQDGVN
jgi:type IV pilus assembly protein PilA